MKPTKIRIMHAKVTPEGILIKSIGLYTEEGEYIREAKLNGQVLCSLVEPLLPIVICK